METEHLLRCFWRRLSLLAFNPTGNVIIKMMNSNNSLDVWVSPSPTGWV